GHRHLDRVDAGLPLRSPHHLPGRRPLEGAVPVAEDDRRLVHEVIADDQVQLAVAVHVREVQGPVQRDTGEGGVGDLEDEVALVHQDADAVRGGEGDVRQPVAVHVAVGDAVGDDADDVGRKRGRGEAAGAVAPEDVDAVAQRAGRGVDGQIDVAVAVEV